MTHTAANVPVQGRAYTIVGPHKQTVTDITWSSTTASEVVTAAELGLNAVFDASAVMQTVAGSDTAVEVACVIGSANNQVTVTPNAAAAAGSTLSTSVVRVWARGY